MLSKISNNEYAIVGLKQCYDGLLNDPLYNVPQIPELFQYRASFIPKDPSEEPIESVRPIAQQECALNIMHKIILKNIKKPLSPY